MLHSKTYGFCFFIILIHFALPVFAQDFDPSGLDEEPFSENASSSSESPAAHPMMDELSADEEPFSEFSGNPPLSEEKKSASDPQTQEKEQEYPPRVSFTHRYRAMGGYTDTQGLISFENTDFQLKELRFITSYQQTIKIRTSPQFYNSLKISVVFAQNYDTINQRYVDNQFALREIYFNYQTGSHQFRIGSQNYTLGKVDLDRPIDVLNQRESHLLNTLDPTITKESLPSLKYDWIQNKTVFTFYAAPMQQRTLGMDFTDFREESELNDQGKKPENKTFLRDYFGVQYEWIGDWNPRIGLFHWFDQDSDISWEYKRSTSDVSTSLLSEQSSLNHFVSTYTERESNMSFVTFELDAVLGSNLWKLDAGLFGHKNFYSYNRPNEDLLIFDTVRVPYFATATSLERTFSNLFLMGIYSYRRLFLVPGDSHLILYENHETPEDEMRNLYKFQATGIIVWKFNNNTSTKFVALQTWPFLTSAFFSSWTWSRYEYDSEWDIQFFHGQTDKIQKMLDERISSNQMYIVYARNFSGL